MSDAAELTPVKPKRAAYIHGRQFLDWLLAAGIIPDKTTRVVIEASVREPVRIYLEQYGDENLIAVEPPPELRGAQIVIAEKRSETDEALGTWGR